VKIPVALLVLGTTSLLAAPATTPPKAEWKEFTWKAGKCSVLLPGTPQEKKAQLMIAEGKTIYMIDFADLPGMAKADEKTVAGFLDMTRDQLVKAMKGKLLSEKKVELGPYHGRDLTIESKQQGADLEGYRTRLYLAADRFYQLMLMGTKDAVSSKHAEKFFGSFKLVK
jgi:hypothetical protein